MSVLTDKRVEDMYSWAIAWHTEPQDEHVQRIQDSNRKQFREWLARHDREVASRAWDEGHEDGEYDERNRARIEYGTRSATSNPYRAEAGE